MTLVALLVIFVVVLVLSVGVAKIVDLVRERDELVVDNRSMRQRLTVARTLVEQAQAYIECDEPLPYPGWRDLAFSWLRDEDADPHVVVMRERVAKLKAQREIDAIRS